MVWGKGEGYKSVFLEYEEGTEDNGVDEGVDGEGGEVCIGERVGGERVWGEIWGGI